MATKRPASVQDEQEPGVEARHQGSEAVQGVRSIPSYSFHLVCSPASLFGQDEYCHFATVVSDSVLAVSRSEKPFDMTGSI